MNTALVSRFSGFIKICSENVMARSRIKRGGGSDLLYVYNVIDGIGDLYFIATME